MTNSHQIFDAEFLEKIYGQASPASVKKEINYNHPHYRKFIEASPFVILATSGKDGLDVSPRGDPVGFVSVADEKTLLIPDRRGNNRIDSLRNILSDPRIALIFFIPGVGETLRVIGQARILIDPALMEKFSMDGKLPRSVLEVHVESVFFQCSKAILRSKLWHPESKIDRKTLPSVGTILMDLSHGEINGNQYDAELPDRIKTTMY
jgi:PPOX class probable FMN-dependent enzyme